MRRRRLLKTALFGGAALSAAARAAPAAGVTPPPLRPLPAPPPLRPGSRVLAVAPGTWWDDAPAEAERLHRRCQAEGWQLEVPAVAAGRWRWFSAPDGRRRAELERAWADPGVDAVFAVAGGWGSARVLEQGWHPPQRPLWLVGYSDISALLLAQLAAGRSGGIHAGTMVEGEPWQRLVALLRAEPVPPLRGVGWRPGSASGPLVVTNLTVATALIGTPWLPSLRGCVLLLEDVGEAPYRVDRLLTQWRTAGLLRDVAAIGLGWFRWQENDVLPGDLSLEEVLLDRLGDLGVPLLARLPFGHGRPNLALPMGRMARLDADRGELTLL